MNQFNKIWLPLADRFYRVAYYLLESQEDAEDAVQELYVKLLRSPGSAKLIRDPLAYGITLLRNICIDTIRRREKRKSMTLEECMMVDSREPEKLLSEKDYLNRLISEIDKLPKKQAEVLKMRALEGLEYEKISRMFKLAGAAAVVVIAVGLSLFKSDNEPVDTFDDPYQAYAELEKALAMVSEGMQKGIDKTVEILK